MEAEQHQVTLLETAAAAVVALAQRVLLAYLKLLVMAALALYPQFLDRLLRMLAVAVVASEQPDLAAQVAQVVVAMEPQQPLGLMEPPTQVAAVAVAVFLVRMLLEEPVVQVS
jgi:hypothetical protein